MMDPSGGNKQVNSPSSQKKPNPKLEIVNSFVFS